MKVLVVNAGSSSLKYQLFDTAKNEVLAKGICERIGTDGKIDHKCFDGRRWTKEIDMPNHSVATKIVVDTLTGKDYGCISSMDEIEAVGHRIVHGGPFFFESCLLTPEVLDKLERCRDLAPLHTGAHLMGIKGCTAVMPNVPQVLVFDTAFHQTMPAKACTYPLPFEICEKYHIRRYGFHGTSHKFVSREMIKLLGKPAEETKIVTCHIGNGASMAAVKGGKVIDTTMGFTPLDGVEMGTRCGSIDPAIVPIIMKKEGLTPDEMDTVMNKKSGMLGLCGTSDNRTIESRAKEGDKRARLIESMLCHQLTKYIGGYAAAMGGLDAIVFTGGIGENNPQYRDRVCDKLKFMGVEINYEINDKLKRGPEGEISTPNSKVKVYVICTNEELMIARDTKEIVEAL